MWLVGGAEAVGADAAALVDDTRQAMWLGIRQCRPGNHIGDIGFAIQEFAEQNGYGVVREFVGHGIGQHFHESPMVPHYGEPGKGPLLEVGMVITIEPMLNQVCHSFANWLSPSLSLSPSLPLSLSLSLSNTRACADLARGLSG